MYYINSCNTIYTIRKVINISVPEKIYKLVEHATKERGFASKSEYIRSVLRECEENKVVTKIRKRQKEAHNGNVKKIRSLRELM